MSRKSIFKKLTMMVIAFAFVLTSISPAFAATTKDPALNASKKTIVVGKSFDFNVNNKVKGATYDWKVGNDRIASVDKSNGIVTGVSAGNTNVYCTIHTLGKTYRLVAKLTVLKPAVKVTITNKVNTLNVKDYYKLKVSLTPASSNDKITWTSSDSSIAKVDSDGSFAVVKTGKVTITATSVSGRSDSVTINVLGEGEDVADNVTKPEEDGNKEDTKDDVKVIKTIIKEDFSSSVGKFAGRGSATISQSTAGAAAEGGKGYMSVKGRTATWNGATVDVTSLVTPGATYRVTGWVRYTSGENVETFKITQQRDDKDGTAYPGISGSVEVEKGKWIKISGLMEVSPSTTNCNVYFETNSLIDFFVDNVAIEQIEAEEIKEEVVEVEKAKVGDIVFKSDFEDGSILDPRGSSVRTNTTKVAHNGKASLEVTRTAGWDGAGVRFNVANNITKASYFGMTVHTSAYVMYNEGPDQVNFKLNNKLEKADNSDNILSQITVKKGEWTKIEADCFIADKAIGDMIFFETENNDALTFYIDDVEINVVK